MYTDDDDDGDGFLLLVSCALHTHPGKVLRKCGICKDIPVKFYHPVICIFGTLYDYNKSGIQIRDGHEVVSKFIYCVADKHAHGHIT